MSSSVRSGSPHCFAGAGAVRGPTRARRAALALATLALATVAFAARADAYVYWAAAPFQPNQGTNPAIGRALNDGSNPNQTFITDPRPSNLNWGSGPYGLAVDLAPDIHGNKYVYWTALQEPGNPNNGGIGRAQLTADGAGTPQTLIFDAGFFPIDVAVGGGYIYWSISPRTDVQRPGAIGAAILPDLERFSDGFVQPLNQPEGIAIDATYIYWVDSVPLIGGSTPVSTIGRARLDGQDIPNERWLVAANANDEWSDVAVDAKHVYWSNRPSGGGAGQIGRAKLNGSGAPTAVNPDYITATNPAAVAVDATHIYWSNFDQSTQTGSIGSANLNATNIQQSIVGPLENVTVPGLAVDAGPYACAGEAATIAGTGKSESLRGTNGDDVIAARGGADTVSARGGDDLVCGADGADVIRGQGGDDVIHAGADDDELTGGGGKDEIRGKGGDDSLTGGTSDDELTAGGGDDELRGMGRNDTLRAGDGDDVLRGGGGNNVCRGGGGDDIERRC